jgi:hypothetical protein
MEGRRREPAADGRVTRGKAMDGMATSLQTVAGRAREPMEGELADGMGPCSSVPSAIGRRRRPVTRPASRPAGLGPETPEAKGRGPTTVRWEVRRPGMVSGRGAGANCSARCAAQPACGQDADAGRMPALLLRLPALQQRFTVGVRQEQHRSG